MRETGDYPITILFIERKGVQEAHLERSKRTWKAFVQVMPHRDAVSGTDSESILLTHIYKRKSNTTTQKKRSRGTQATCSATRSLGRCTN
jgi:hypothetical protein